MIVVDLRTLELIVFQLLKPVNLKLQGHKSIVQPVNLTEIFVIKKCISRARLATDIAWVGTVGSTNNKMATF